MENLIGPLRIKTVFFVFVAAVLSLGFWMDNHAFAQEKHPVVKTS